MEVPQQTKYSTTSHPSPGYVSKGNEVSMPERPESPCIVALFTVAKI
jgi:hypothetical protein